MKGIKRTLGLALALTTLPSPVAAQNEILAEIPIELRGNRVIIPVSVGSSGPHRLILDTGMAYDGITLFDTASVDLSQFDHLARVQIRGAGPGGAAHALSDSAATFRAGTRTFEDQRVTMLTGGAFRDFPTDGVIGYSILGHHVVEIDYDPERMILYDPETFSPADDWVSVDIYFKDNRIPWTDISVATEEEDPVRLSSYIDFAAEEALELLTVYLTAELRGVVDRIMERIEGEGFLFPAPRDYSQPIRRELVSKWLREAEVLAKLPKQDGTGIHGLRRKFATERKHLPVQDVASVGGWKDLDTLLQVYQQPDEATQRRVLSEPQRI